MKKICFISLLGTLGLFSQSPRFSFSVDSIEISTQEEFPQTTSVKVFLAGGKEGSKKRGILGKTVVTEDGLSFYPWVPFQREVEYTIDWNGETKNFSIPREEKYKVLKVIAVHPSSETIPSNTLKWYIQFSRRVNPTNIYNHIRLVDASGNEVERAILHLSPPLLSEDGKTLTLWMEPGRQKRDLGPNERLGEVMQPNQSYILKVAATLKDDNGLNLKTGIQHHFKTTVPDRISPNAEQWNIKLPSRNSKGALKIFFGENLDYGSLHESFAIFTTNGEELMGSFEYQDSRIDFYPATTWKAGTYKLKFSKRIEDVSGNNLERLFDRDTAAPLLNPTLERTFTIGD